MIVGTLTQSQIDTILAGPADAQSNLLLEKFGFAWSPVSSPPAVCDAIGIYGTDEVVILTINGASLEYWIWDGTTPASGAHTLSHTPVKVRVCDGAQLAYYIYGNDLYSVDLTNGVETLVATADSVISGFGVASVGSVHLALVNSVDITRFAYWGGAAISYSELYWPFSIENFDARRLADGSADTVLVSGAGVPYKSVVAQGSNAAWVTKTTTLIASFVYEDGEYSDHYGIMLGETEIGQSVSHGLLFTCEKGAGAIYQNSAYGSDMVVITTSPHGRVWEIPTPLRFTPAGQCYFVVVGDTMYFYCDGLMYSSPAIYRVGVHNANVQLDVTDSILNGSVSLRVRAGMSVTLEATDAIRSFLSDEQPVMLIYSAGYYYNESIVTAIFLGESNTISETKAANGQVSLLIEAVDVLSWLDRKSGYFIEVPSITGGYDPFTDTSETDTEYGGMRHIYAVQSSWRTPIVTGAGYVLSPTEYADGRVVAFSTFVDNALNGFIQTAYSYGDAAGETVGVVVRGVSAYILTQALWIPATGRVEISHYTGGRTGDEMEQVVMASGAASLAARGWLRYVVRYALHRLSYSADGLNYTQILEAISSEGAYPGHFGVVGNVNKPPPIWSPGGDFPPWDPPPWEPPLPIVIGGGNAVVVVYFFSGVYHVYYSPNVLDATVLWHNITANLSISSFGSVAMLDSGVLLTAEDSVYYCKNPNAPSWVPVAAPGGYSYKGAGFSLRPFVERSPDGTAVMIDVWQGNVRYAWILDAALSTLYITKVGVQLYHGSLHASWSGSSAIAAGHTNAAVNTGCTAQIESVSGESCAIDSTMPNSYADVTLRLTEDDDCWHYAVVSFKAITIAYHEEWGTPSDITAGWSFYGGAYSHGYFDGAWVISANGSNATHLLVGETGSAAMGFSVLVRIRKTGNISLAADTKRWQVSIEIIEAKSEVCWGETGSEPFTATPDDKYLYHLRVPLGYTGDLSDLAHGCCAATGDPMPCPSWASEIVKQASADDMLMSNGSVLVTSDTNICDAGIVTTADAPLDALTRGFNIVQIGEFQYAVSLDRTELQMSSNNFLTHTSTPIPSYVGDAYGSAAVFLDKYIIVYGSGGVALYNPLVGWYNITGNLSLNYPHGGDSHIAASAG